MIATATTAKITTTLAGMALSTEQAVLNAACVVWSYRLESFVVDLVISRRGGRIIRAHVLEIGQSGTWHHFTGTPRDNARDVLAVLR